MWMRLGTTETQQIVPEDVMLQSGQVTETCKCVKVASVVASFGISTKNMHGFIAGVSMTEQFVQV